MDFSTVPEQVPEQAAQKSDNRRGNRGCIKIENPQKKDHADPPEGAHGLCLANPARVAFIGGVGASKTTTLLNILARCAEWKPFEHIYLMGPSGCLEGMQKGEYGLLDVTPLDRFPPLDYFAGRPGRSALIIDDKHLADLSKNSKNGPSQRELADRVCGHVSSHHPGGLSIFVAQQTFVAIPPSIRRLMSHWVLFCNCIDRAAIPYIARGVMLEKSTLEKCFDFCTENPYDFLLVTNQPDGRPRVRVNGWRGVRGLL
jgi:hypothetical protein